MPTEVAPLEVIIESFDPVRHDRTRFQSGATRIDNYLKLTAKKHAKGDFARVWVAVRSGEPTVIGYYAINAHAVDMLDLPDNLRRNAPSHEKIPAAYLSIVGVDRRFQGQGLGRALLLHALRRVEEASRTIAIEVVLLDVLEDGDAEAFRRRKSFYSRMGFIAVPKQPARMFIAIETVRKAFSL